MSGAGVGIALGSGVGVSAAGGGVALGMGVGVSAAGVGIALGSGAGVGVDGANASGDGEEGAGGALSCEFPQAVVMAASVIRMIAMIAERVVMLFRVLLESGFAGL